MESIERYVTHWRKRIQQQQQRDRTRAESALSDLSKVVDILKKYDVKRIILFGSLATGDYFRKNSDIDLAVEGLKGEDFLRAYADLMLALNWSIDLKPLEEITGIFRETILKRGKIIYEK